MVECWFGCIFSRSNPVHVDYHTNRNCTSNYDITIPDDAVKWYYMMPSPHISYSCMLKRWPQQNEMEQLKMWQGYTFILGSFSRFADSYIQSFY